MPTSIDLPHGGYRKLIAYRKSETIYQGTVDRLRSSGKKPWAAGDDRLEKARAFAKDHPDWDGWRELFETRPEKTLCNLMIVLCHQEYALLTGMIKRQEETFKKNGGIRERMHAARTEARAEEWDKAIYSRLDLAKTPDELAQRASDMRAALERAAHAIRRRKGWEP